MWFLLIKFSLLAFAKILKFSLLLCKEWKCKEITHYISNKWVCLKILSKVSSPATSSSSRQVCGAFSLPAKVSNNLSFELERLLDLEVVFFEAAVDGLEVVEVEDSLRVFWRSKLCRGKSKIINWGNTRSGLLAVFKIWFHEIFVLAKNVTRVYVCLDFYFFIVITKF